MGILGCWVHLCHDQVSTSCPQCIYTYVNPSFLPFIPRNCHLIKGFAIFLKRTFFGTLHPSIYKIICIKNPLIDWLCPLLLQLRIWLRKSKKKFCVNVSECKYKLLVVWFTPQLTAQCSQIWSYNIDFSSNPIFLK